MSLQRRRVNKGSESGGADRSISNGNASERIGGNLNGLSSRGDDSGEGITHSHKVAYDPAEQRLRENFREPKLTLMEEVLLMGLKDREGYISFWNDNISYALRGCILIELALRGKIRVIEDPTRKRFDVSERLIEVMDAGKTGEALLDETLSLMKSSEALSIANWIDLLSGETWNFLKINYQLKQVRERLAKGLVDKGVLRTEMKNFFLFDMATHPVADQSCKEAIKRRVLSVLVPRTVTLNYTEHFPESVAFKYLRTVALICGAYGANVLENILLTLDYDKRERGFTRADELLAQFSQYPFVLDKDRDTGISVNLNQEIQKELENNQGTGLQLEVVAGVFEVFARMDNLL